MRFRFFKANNVNACLAGYGRIGIQQIPSAKSIEICSKRPVIFFAALKFNQTNTSVKPGRSPNILSLA